MTAQEVAAAAVEHLSPITAILDDTVAEAIADAERRTVGVNHNRFPYLRPLMVRALVRISLEDGRLPDDWCVEGRTNRMGELYVKKHGVMSLRLLKGSPLQPNGVPHAGPNQARQQAWFQSPLPDPSLARTAEELSFLLLWAYEDKNDRTSGFTLSLAHTLRPGLFGAQVPCDLLVSIPRGGTMFENLRPFVNDENVDLFAGEVEILDEADE